MRRSEDCFREQIGKHLLSLSFTGSDPNRKVPGPVNGEAVDLSCET